MKKSIKNFEVKAVKNLNTVKGGNNIHTGRQEPEPEVWIYVCK